MSSQSSSFGAFLDTYDRLTAPKKSTPRDATAAVLATLVSRKEMSLSDLVSTSSIDVRDLESAIEKLKKLGAIKLAGSGLQQRVTITEKAGDLLELFR